MEREKLTFQKRIAFVPKSRIPLTPEKPRFYVFLNLRVIVLQYYSSKTEFFFA